MTGPQHVGTAGSRVSRCICRNEQAYASTRCANTTRTPASQHASPHHLQAAVLAAAGPLSMHLLDCHRYSNRYNSCTDPAGAHTQRPLSQASLLERAAAAPRPAAVPEQLEASTSSCSSSTRSNGVHYWVRSSRESRANGFVLQPGVAAVAAAGTAATVEVGGMSDMSHAASSDHLVLDNHPSSSSSSVASSGSCYSASGRLSREGLQLMQDIMRQHSWRDLADLIQQQATQCTAPHCAAALHKLATLWQQQQLVQQQQPHMRAELRLQYPAVLKVAAVLLRGFQQQITAAGFRDLADALHALITLGFQTQQLQQQQQQQQQQSVGDGSLTYTANHARNSSSSGAAALVEAALPGGISEGFCHDVLQHSHKLLLCKQFKPQQLSRVLWAFAQLEVKPPVDWWSVALNAAADTFQQQQQHGSYDQQQNYKHHHHQQQQQQQQQQRPQQQQQQCFSPQGLALTGWAVAKLQAPATAAWWNCYMAAAAAAMSHMEPQHLSNCIWALATAQQVPDQNWMNAFYSATAKYLDLQHVSNSCCNNNNSHNGIQQDRINAEARISPRFSPQGLANTLWALAVLQQQQPQHWQQQYDAASAAELPNFSMQHLSMTLWAYGRFSSSSQQQQHQQHQQRQQQQQPSAGWFDQFWVQLSSVGSEVTAQSVACIVWGLVKVGVAVPPPRAHQLDVLVCEVIRDATPQGLAIIVWAMGIIRGSGTSRKLIQHIRYYCLNHQQQLATCLTPQGLVMLLSGLRRFKAWQPDSLKQQLLTAVVQRLLLDPPSSSSSSGGGSGEVSRSVFKACELPVVLLSLVQLRIAVPTVVLETAQELLLQQQQQHLSQQQQHASNLQQQQQYSLYQQQQQQRQLDSLTTGQLSVCLYALGLAKHHPSEALLQAAAAAVQTALCNMGHKDVAFVLYGLAAMRRGCGQQQQQQVEAVLQQLLYRAIEVLDQCDHKCLAMIMWALATLQLRPADAFLQHCLAVTTAQLPDMTLLSVTTVLTSLQTMQYLPPVHWMVATCKAARLKVNSDKTVKAYQRRACVRRLEDSIAWYNSVLALQQQQQQQQQPSGSGVQRRLSDAVLKGAAGVLGAGNTSSEAVIAAAVGVAAAVAQQWRW